MCLGVCELTRGGKRDWEGTQGIPHRPSGGARAPGSDDAREASYPEDSASTRFRSGVASASPHRPRGLVPHAAHGRVLSCFARCPHVCGEAVPAFRGLPKVGRPRCHAWGSYSHHVHDLTSVVIVVILVLVVHVFLASLASRMVQPCLMVCAVPGQLFRIHVLLLFWRMRRNPHRKQVGPRAAFEPLAFDRSAQARTPASLHGITCSGRARVLSLSDS